MNTQGNSPPDEAAKTSPLDINNLATLTRSQKIYLKGVRGIMDIKALAAIMEDPDIGLPGLREELALDAKAVEALRAEIIAKGRANNWEAFPEADGGWQPAPSPMGFIVDEEEIKNHPTEEGGPA